MLYAHCRIPVGVALRLGITDAGDCEVEVDAESLGGLSQNERKELELYVTEHRPIMSYMNRLMLDGPATIASVVAAVRAKIATKAAERAETYANRERRIVAALAAPDDAWISYNFNSERYYLATPDGDYSRSASGCSVFRPQVATYPSGCYLAGNEIDDPRIVERRACVERDVLCVAASEFDRRYAEWKACVERARAEDELRARAEREEALIWIESYGSSRLKKIVRANLLDRSMNVYLDERLAHDRPGWAWGSCGREIINPSEAALDALAEACEVDSNARLAWVPKAHSCDDPDSCDGGCEDRSFAAVVSTFLGKAIYKEV